MRDVYLSVTIDCECDKGPKWEVARPLSFRGVTEGMGNILEPLFRRRRAKATYLLSAELFDDGPSVDVLRRLAATAELGTHLHGEFVPPDAHVPATTAAFQKDYAPAVEREKMTHLTARFEATFGAKPTSFRAGRFGVGPASLPILEALGYQVDTSVTPLLDWSDKGTDLSFREAPRQPYYPARDAPGRRGDSPVLEVPVTLLPPRFSGVPLVGPRLEPRWLRPSWGTPEAIVAVATEAIAEARRFEPHKRVFLNCMFHNVEVIAGASPYGKDDAGARRVVERLDALLAFAERESIPVIGVSQVRELL